MTWQIALAGLVMFTIGFGPVLVFWVDEQESTHWAQRLFSRKA